MTDTLERLWKQQFPTCEFNADDPRLIVVRDFTEFFQDQGRSLFKLKDLAKAGPLRLDFKDLLRSCPLEELQIAIQEHPEDTIACMGFALGLIRPLLCPSGHAEDKVCVRLAGYEPMTPMREVKANMIGKMVCLRGNVVRVSTIRPQVLSLYFKCKRCGTAMHKPLVDGRYDQPTRCDLSNCKSRLFEPLLDTAQTRDWQKIKLQELDEGYREQGRIPRTVEVELTEDLVDACVPGDVVTVVGVAKALQADDGSRGRGKPRALFLLYVDAVSVENARASKSADGSSAEDASGTQANGGSAAADAAAPGKLDIVQFTTRDMQAIHEIATQPRLLELVVASLCPMIYGHETVKMGLALALFGGTRRGDTRQRIAVRGDPHVLVVGDPGMGKSQMLQAVAALAPRGVYVCGNTTSTTGLTVTMVRDQVSGEYALEAGALVLGDQGVCCIDEFDKMGAERSALLEAMEQQSISIAKAGICCSLSSRTAVLAAANPAGGHYNKAKTVAENLRMDSALLSRFDILFILLDRPDAGKDKMLSEHVMRKHALLTSEAANRRRERAAAALGVPAFGAEPSHPAFVGSSQHPGSAPAAGAGGAATLLHPDGRRPLADRLREGVAMCADPVPVPLLRKYIAYARRYVHPALSPDAARVFQRFYLDLRAQAQEGDSVPITTRQLESLIRLGQARARLELREIVTESDAGDVVELLRESMVDVATDDFGVVDFGRGAGMSMAKQVKAFVRVLTRAAEERNSSTFTTQDMRQLAAGMGLDLMDFDSFVDVLNQQNYVLKRGPRLYKLMTGSG